MLAAVTSNVWCKFVHRYLQYVHAYIYALLPILFILLPNLRHICLPSQVLLNNLHTILFRLCEPYERAMDNTRDSSWSSSTQICVKCAWQKLHHWLAKGILVSTTTSRSHACTYVHSAPTHTCLLKLNQVYPQYSWPQ